MGYELKNKIPDPEVLLSLEPEELAGILLPANRAYLKTFTLLELFVGHNVYGREVRATASDELDLGPEVADLFLAAL